MLPVTRANLEYICCICMIDIRPKACKDRVYDLSTDLELFRKLKLTSHISVLKNPRNVIMIKEFCKKVCTLCYDKIAFAYEVRDKILSGCIVLHEAIESGELDDLMSSRLKYVCRVCVRLQQTANEVRITPDILKCIKDCTGLRYSSYRETELIRLKEGTNLTEILDMNDSKFPGQICKICHRKLMIMDELRRQASAAFADMITVCGVIDPKPLRPVQKAPVQIEKNKTIAYKTPEVDPIICEQFENVVLTIKTEEHKKLISEDVMKSENHLNGNALGCPRADNNVVPKDILDEIAYSIEDIDHKSKVIKNEKETDLEILINDDEFLNNDTFFDESSSSSSSSCSSLFSDQPLSIYKKSTKEPETCPITPADDLKDEQKSDLNKSKEPATKPLTRLQCEVCLKKFRYQKLFDAHKLNHIVTADGDTDNTEDSNLKCEYCPEIFSQKTALRSHLKQVHSELNCDENKKSKKNKNPSPLKCDICSKRFKSKKLFDVHKYMHAEGKDDKKPFKCEHCSKCYPTNSGLHRHQKENHSTDGKNKNVCPLCGAHIKHKHHLQEHIAAVHEKKKPFKCNYCDNAFATGDGRRIHELIHTNTFSYTCEVCGKLFRQSSKLKVHMELHTSDPELLCKLCRRAQPSKEALEKHLKQHADKFHQCPYCGKLFKQMYHCVDHQNAVHLKLKPFKCQYCEICFGDRKTRRVHERLHTDNTQYKCSICDLAFKSAQSLSRHKRTANHYAEGEDPSAKKKNYSKKAKKPTDAIIAKHFFLEYVSNQFLHGEAAKNQLV